MSRGGKQQGWNRDLIFSRIGAVKLCVGVLLMAWVMVSPLILRSTVQSMADIPRSGKHGLKFEGMVSARARAVRLWDNMQDVESAAFATGHSSSNLKLLSLHMRSRGK